MAGSEHYERIQGWVTFGDEERFQMLSGRVERCVRWKIDQVDHPKFGEFHKQN